jgi:hypothetical protein
MLAPTPTDTVERPVAPKRRAFTLPAEPRSLTKSRDDLAEIGNELETSRLSLHEELIRVRAADRSNLDAPARAAELLHQQTQARYKAASQTLRNEQRKYAETCFAAINTHEAVLQAPLLEAAELLEHAAAEIVAIGRQIERATGASSHRLLGAASRAHAAARGLKVTLR